MMSFPGRMGVWVRVWIWLWGMAASACTSDDFTAEARALLDGFALGPVPPSPSNAFADDPAAAALGQQFFFDPRFSGPLAVGDDGRNGGLGAPGERGRVSCASCHDPARGGSDHRSQGPTSLGAAWTGRNAPTVYNVAYASWMFWDGRKDSVWSQALGPLESAAEHNITRLEVAHLVREHYRDAYEAVFQPLPDLADAVRFPREGKPGDPAFDQMAEEDREAVDRVFVNFGKAIEAYERLLVDRDTPLDRYLAGDRSALSPAAIRGAKLFIGRAACNECHSGPLFSDGRFHNLGLAQIGPAVPAIDEGRAAGIAVVKTDLFNQAGRFSDAPRSDHLDALAATPRDLGAMRTASLRGITRTAPYMHAGQLQTLWDVLVWYRAAAGTDGFVGDRDAHVAPLLLDDAEVGDLVEFLGALEGVPLPAALVSAPALP